jgi:hypothetical protein
MWKQVGSPFALVHIRPFRSARRRRKSTALRMVRQESKDTIVVVALVAVLGRSTMQPKSML